MYIKIYIEIYKGLYISFLYTFSISSRSRFYRSFYEIELPLFAMQKIIQKWWLLMGFFPSFSNCWHILIFCITSIFNSFSIVYFGVSCCFIYHIIKVILFSFNSLTIFIKAIISSKYNIILLNIWVFPSLIIGFSCFCISNNFICRLYISKSFYS